MIATAPSAGSTAHRAVLLLFAGALLSSSLLMFVVEPVVGRMVLPLLGGAPAVWNTCVMFFQAMLLAGYAYAHVGPRLLGTRRHAAAHLLVLTVSAVCAGTFLTIDPPPTGAAPVGWLLTALGLSIGLPFFLLAATAPLLQVWFSRTRYRGASDPYFLYAASNIGSLAGLLMYPAIIEPLLPLRAQASFWRVGYGLFAFIAACCVAVLWLRGDAVGPAEQPSARTAAAESSVGWGRRFEWMALAFVPSSLMLAVTSFISTDVAAVPLLWVAPLALYLLTFVLAFSFGEGGVWTAADRLLPLVLLLLVLFLVLRVTGPISVVVVVHLLAFFLSALVCHRALAAARPTTVHLTQFYLLVAVGGSAGSVFNTLVAPWIFTGILEYPAALLLVCLLRKGRDLSSAPGLWWRRLAPPVIGICTAVMLMATMGVESLPLRLALMGIPALLCVSLGRTRLPFAAALAGMLLASILVPDALGRTLFAERTFFGTYRVRLDPTSRYRTLWHGTTLHGIQGVSGDRRAEALSYYHRSGPLGDVFSLDAATQPDIGVVGLGVGSIAAYRLDDQTITFYEIDPAVEVIARAPGFFTYLPECAHDCRVVIGDARRSLAGGAEMFGLLVLDAFSSDAIPVHLLTREAVQIYLSRLSPNGVIAFHISNRHLDLEPVLATLARELQLAALIRRDQVVEADDSGRRSSNWVVLARDAADLQPLAASGRWSAVRGATTARLWTDDFSNVLALLVRQ